ncbi:MAG: NHLP bacteriocin system secretion protein [Betaproteobacteria bacterium]
MEPAREQIFRKVALERLSSPEQLDQLMRVISPLSWLALLPLMGLILVALMWGWFGSVPTKVFGKCLLINPIGLADVTSLSTGRVTEVLVHVDDTVKLDQIVARVAQPELTDRIEKMESRLRELESQGRIVRSFSDRTGQLSGQSIAQQKQGLEAQLQALQERARIYRQRIETQQQLLESGLITRQQLLQTRQDQTQAELDADNVRGQIKQLDLSRLQTAKQGQNEIANAESQINEARRMLDSLLENRKQMTTVLSPYEGRVVDIKTDIGSLVAQGSSLMTIEKATGERGGLQAVIYVPAAEGRKVQAKMTAQVTPSTVKREEYGFMFAEVAYVSAYPATAQSMMLLLQNETLVRALMGDSPPTEIRATLVPADNFSGYRWTSPAGPPVSIKSGTLCAAEIVVERQRPVSLVIPVLKKSLGVD